MKRITLLVLILFMGLSCKTQETPKIEIVDKAFFQEEVIGKDVQLVDVRTPEEFEAGFIDDAVNYNIIDSETFLEQIKTLDKDQPVYLYCRMGGRSNRAAELMKELGFTKLYDYGGGYNDWVTE